MTTDPPEPKPRRKWHFYKWLVLLIVATFAYAQWRAYAIKSTIKEAEALGWVVTYIDPLKVIRKYWKKAFEMDTWTDGVKQVLVLQGETLLEHPEILLRLNPKQLMVDNGKDLRDLSMIKGLTRMDVLFIADGPNLTSIDALAHFPALRRLDLLECTALENLDALKNLKALERFEIRGSKALKDVSVLANFSALKSVRITECTALTNVDALKELKTLERVDLSDCPSLTNVDALIHLPSLIEVRLQGYMNISKESIAALKAALPNTQVITEQPPPFPKPNELDTPPGARDTER